MLVKRLLRVLSARRRLVALTAVGTAVFLVALALFIHPRYKASAAVLVEHGATDPIAGMPLPVGLVSNYIATQADILSSERVALRAIRALGLEKDALWRERWQDATGGEGSMEAWLAVFLTKRLKVSPSRDSNVLGIAYTSPDAHFAAAVVNAFVQAYIDTTLELRVDPARAYNGFFAERAEQLRRALAAAQARLSEHQAKHGLMATDEGIDVETRRLSELQSQLVEVQDALATAKARESQARATPRHTPEVLADPVVASLTAELARQEAKLGELQSHLGERHPDVMDAAAGVAELRKRVEAAVQRASSASGVSLHVAERRASELRDAIERQRAKLTEQKAQRDRAALLTREVENASRAYDAVVTRASQTALESANRQANVSWLKVATPPSEPLWPYWLHFAVAVVLSLLVGALHALVREHRDRRLRTPDDVRAGLGQAVLFELPDGRAPNAASAADRRSRLVRERPQLAAT